MNDPKISIIVPVYNTGKYLRTCLESIMSQTFSDFEAILVDDGSTDDSGRICDDYAAMDSRFVVIHKQNEGVAKARITAFKCCRGKLISFIDSDDYVTPDYLLKLSKPLLEEDADMVSCNYYSIDNGEQLEARDGITGTFNKEEIKDFIANHFFYDDILCSYGMNIYLWTKMVKREFVMDALKIGEDMWYAEDQIGVFHMLQRCQKLVILPDRLYCYVQHQSQTMKKYDFALWGELILLMERYKELDKENLAEIGRRKRTWRHIDYTIFNKITRAQLSRKDFCAHLSQVRAMPYMKEFFSPPGIDFNLKENIKYWLLKLHMFNAFYLLVLRSRKNFNKSNIAIV